MKIKLQNIGITLLAITGLLSVSTANATTAPSSIKLFTPANMSRMLAAKNTAWRDPAFGDLGWTHTSSWGRFSAKKGQKVLIRIKSNDARLHPGATVWYRGSKDTAPNNYVPDHFYPQNASQTQHGAIDEVSGQVVGDIVMRLVTFGYDADGHVNPVVFPRGKKDGIPGRLVLWFTAPANGYYQFVTGGFNPDPGMDGSLKYNLWTTVKVMDP